MPDPARQSVIYGPYEHRPVWVRHTDGHEYAGRLEAWLATSAGWRAMVRYHVGVGLQHYLDVAADQVQQRGDDEPTAGGYRRPA